MTAREVCGALAILATAALVVGGLGWLGGTLPLGLSRVFPPPGLAR